MMSLAPASSSPPRSIPVDRILQLPPFPAVARQLMAVMAKPNFTIPDVSRLVRSDAVFAAEVLRLANSAILGLRYEVVSVLHAISVLGMDRLQGLVLTVAMRDFIKGARPLGLLRLCWRHNLATALVAEALAEACSVERSDAYTAALLHDIGRLALVSAFPGETTALLDCWSREGEEVPRAEEEALGINHREAAMVLAEKWGLPSLVREVLRSSAPSPAGPFTVIRLVHIACGVADRLGFSLGESTLAWDTEWLAAELPAGAWPRLETKVEGWRETIPMKINLFECEFMPG